MPAWLFYVNSWDLIGMFAYTQIFALLEGAVILLILILLGAILPVRFFRDRFVAQGSMAVLLTSGWAIAAQFANQYQIVVVWTPKTFFLWSVLDLISVGVSWVLIHRYKRLEEAINSFIERLTVLLYVYIPITFLSVIIVTLRNIYRSI